MPNHPPSPSHATLAGIGSIALWSFSGICYAVGCRALGPMPSLCMSAAVGVLTIVLLRALRRQRVLPLFTPPLRVAVAGLFGIVLYSLLLGYAMGMAPEQDLANIMLLNYLWPIWIVLLSFLLLDEKRSPLRAIAGALLGFAGVTIALGANVLPASFIPHAMAAIGGLLWALYSVLLRRWNIPSERGGSTFGFLLLAIAAALLAARTSAWRLPTRADVPGLAITIFGGIGPVGLAYFWWEIAMKRGALHTLAILSYFIPIASALLIGLAFHQSIRPQTLPAAILIALGAWISHTGGQHRSPEAGTSSPSSPT